MIAANRRGEGSASRRGTLADTSGARATPILLTRALWDELVAWARAGHPDEAWGIVAGTAPPAEGGLPLRFHAMTNAAASPDRYRDVPAELLRVMLAIEDAGEVPWAIFHSHVRSPAEPSPTDVELAHYPDSLYLICSLADTGAPTIRAWSICEGSVEEWPLEAA